MKHKHESLEIWSPEPPALQEEEKNTYIHTVDILYRISSGKIVGSAQNVLPSALS